ncbi:MAG: TIGR03960 family B12-binding radical SAM protein [candidate division WOR-3 bacterium]
MDESLGEVLPLATKPIRYTGGEYNALFREPDPGRVSWVLALPDVYELGMSNHGLRILYSVINRLDNAQAERVYVPWPDFGQALAGCGLRLYALESKRPVAEFDILGISLQSELEYTNVLYLLELAGLPLRRTERDERHPLVIAGGPCTVNPLPMADFFDAFVVGDGEDAVRDITRVFAETGRSQRGQLLAELARLPGLYVPDFRPKDAIVTRRVVPELKEQDSPFPPVVPICEITHDRLTIEIARGCTRGCRFCQAGMVNRPLRFRPQDEIVRLAERGIRATGWEELSLLSLSALDYPDLIGLVRRLNERLKERRVAISLPSTRGEDFSAELALTLQEVKKTGLTFAPETASPRLRSFLNKDISEARIIESVRNALDAGWNGVKLYFMVGLPGETDADVAEIGRFVTEIARLCRGRLVRFNLSPFVPKPHTPLQWAAFADYRETQAKIDQLRAGINRRNVKAKWENPECSMVQAVLARGDERLGRLIELVYRRGGVFQEWTEHFRLGLWTESSAEAGIDLSEYLAEREPSTVLPWDFVDVGVSREFLRTEYARALAGQMTPDCTRSECTRCGACAPESVQPQRAASVPDTPTDLNRLYGRKPRLRQSHEELRTRFRLRYTVEEQYRFAGHLDRVRAFYRALRRSELPVAYTKGFAPKPMLSFGPPLPVGVVSAAEYLDLFSAYHYTGNIVRDLSPFLPRGLRLTAGRAIPREAPSLGRIINLARYDVALPPDVSAEPDELVERGKKMPGVKELLEGPDRTLVLDLSIEPGIKLFDVLAKLFGVNDRKARCISVKRRECLVAETSRIRTPLED